MTGANGTNGHTNGSNHMQAEFDEVPLQVFTLQDIRAGRTPCSLRDVEFLLSGQAHTHKTRYTGNLSELRNKLGRTNTALKGIVLYSEQYGAIALATLFTGFHKGGQRKFYAEDLFVASDFRNHGVFRVLFHEVAKYTVNNGGHHLQWETMSNNPKMQAVIQHYGAIRPDVVTLGASHLLDPKYKFPEGLREAWQNNAYETSIITSQHTGDLGRLGIDPQIVWASGDLPFSGFITHERETKTPVAATAAWPRIGTFDLTDGIVLEHTIKQRLQGESLEQRIERSKQIITSTIATLRETASSYEKANNKPHKIRTAKWLVNTGRDDPTSTYSVLTQDFGLVTEQLGGGDREEWILTNGKLIERANANVPLLMRIPKNKHIGEPIESPVQNAQSETRGHGQQTGSSAANVQFPGQGHEAMIGYQFGPTLKHGS